ncbi:unnamed protein product [Schistosoma curassoni]|uniref:DUF6451 domain-containing protein n=1 Tax=Schistosoma curassoni TaxID=6186 RepID=A0A183KNK6_9TREM|nr:unnamed protein product [Schistosoma curassoni]
MQQSDNTRPRRFARCKTITYQDIIIDEHGGSDADVKARIGKARTPHLQMKNIWNSKQLSIKTKVRIFNTNFKTILLDEVELGESRKPSSRIYKCFLTVVCAKYFRSVGRTLLATTNCGSEQTRSQQRRKKSGRRAVSPHMESSKSKEKRNTKEHITSGNGDRNEKNEQELDGTRKEGPVHSGLENAGQRPMLHCG